MTHDISRRNLLLGAGAMLACCGVAGFPGLTLAAAPTDKRLLVVILRGGMDGLGVIVPYGDKGFADLRRKLAPTPQTLLPMDGFFMMHGALKPLHDMYLQKEMIVLHAAASPYRERSHFDAQNLLENGAVKPHALSTGWLGRSLAALGQGKDGLSLGPAVPLVLQGVKSVQSYTPSALPEVSEDFVNRVMYMYKHDEVLSSALQASRMTPEMDDAARGRGPKQFIEMMKTAAKFMSPATGAKIAAIDLGGWDTHANQGTEKGRLSNALDILAQGIAAYKTGMGDVWEDTAVLAITEFGRTAADNGTGGTDHGTASAAFLLGGNVNGGRVIGDWPGLARGNLYQERDLYPANDLRALLKAVVEAHLGIDVSTATRTIFPESLNVRAYERVFNL